MFCKYHKIAASPTASNTLCGLPANLNAQFIRSYKTYDSSSTKMGYKKSFYNVRQHIKYIRSTQEHLLLALSGFLEDGRQRKAARSSSK